MGSILNYPQEVASDHMYSEFPPVQHFIQFTSREILPLNESIFQTVKNGNVSADGVTYTNPEPTHTINLYIPPDLAQNISISYDNITLPIFNTVALANLPGQIANGNWEGIAAMGSGLAPNILAGLFEVIKGAAGKVPILNKVIDPLAANAVSLAAKAAGMSINPHLTTLFKHVNLREFSFNYIFQPRSEKEADQVEKIIAAFKEGALPSVNSNSAAFLVYPNEFTINCISKEVKKNEDEEGGTSSSTKDNRFLFKTRPCVLNNISILYNHNGQFATFQSKEYDGMPVAMAMRLDFTETSALTRDMVKQKLAY